MLDARRGAQQIDIEHPARIFRVFIRQQASALSMASHSASLLSSNSACRD
jgi:hypothetical protein